MGDRNCGAAFDQILECFLDFAFGFGVDGGSGFVEDQNSRVGKDRAGDGNSLAFAAGEGLAALADEGVVAIRKVQK